MCVLVGFFFFKQKTAYEMRISDWSSDVCSSDLQCQPQHAERGNRDRRPLQAIETFAQDEHTEQHADQWIDEIAETGFNDVIGGHRPHVQQPVGTDQYRSDEHTSELQSLMRISYAVFCLQKKKQNNKETTSKHKF